MNSDNNQSFKPLLYPSKQISPYLFPDIFKSSIPYMSGIPGMFPHIPGMPGIPGMFPYMPGMFPYMSGMPGMFPYMPGMFPYMPGMFPYMPGMFPYMPGMPGMSVQHGQNPVQHGQMSEQLNLGIASQYDLGNMENTGFIPNFNQPKSLSTLCRKKHINSIDIDEKRIVSPLFVVSNDPCILINKLNHMSITTASDNQKEIIDYMTSVFNVLKMVFWNDEIVLDTIENFEKHKKILKSIKMNVEIFEHEYIFDLFKQMLKLKNIVCYKEKKLFFREDDDFLKIFSIVSKKINFKKIRSKKKRNGYIFFKEILHNENTFLHIHNH